MAKFGFRTALALACACALLAAAASHARTDPHAWSLGGNTVFLNLEDTRTTDVRAMVQDRQGFLWLGTDAGLMRWDGYRLQSYVEEPGTPGSLPDTFVRNLVVDGGGRLWVGTNSGGLNRYDPDNDDFVAIPIGPGGTRAGNIEALISDGAGGLWIGTGQGLEHLDGASGRVDPRDAEAPADAITALLLDRQGTLWVGTAGKLLKRPRGASRFEGSPWPAGAEGALNVSALLEDSRGRIWIGTAFHGAYVLEPGQNTPRPLPDSEGEHTTLDSIRTMLDVGTGEVWLGTENGGIVRVDTGTWKVRRERHDATSVHSLPNDQIRSLFLDRGGVVWIGSNGPLSRNDPQQRLIQTYLGGSGPGRLLTDGDVTAVLALPDGRVWAGLGDGGIDIIDPVRGRVGHLQPERGEPERALPVSKVDAMVRADDGTVFAGTAAGLYRCSADARTVARVPFPGRTSSMETRSVQIAAGRLWIGRDDGLWEADIGPSGSVTLLRHFESELGDPRITSLLKGKNATLWIGTQTGLSSLDLVSGALRRLHVDAGDPGALPGGYVSSILTDRNGRLWVATYGRGVQVEQGEGPDGLPRFRRLTHRDGLPQNSADSLLQDAKGYVWLSTDDGLARIDPDSLQIRSYHTSQGLGIFGFWTGAGAATPTNALIFGGLGGLAVLQPDQPIREAAVPALAVTEVHAGNQPMAPALAMSSAGLRVPADDRSIEVEFAALDYSDPEHRHYAYRLQGFDRDWIETPVSRRLAAYTNLPPGDYHLQLRSASADGGWTATLDIPVHVHAAWHQQAAVHVLEAALGCGFVLGLIQLRTVFLRKRQGELERLIADRTAELRRSQEQLEQLAYLDPLTGLPNRRAFSEQLRRMIAARQRGQGSFVLLLIDLDGFKPINDTYGHAIGDELLVAIAAQLRTLVRETDMAARLGGDEFAVLLSQPADLHAIESTCARIVTKLGEPVLVAGHSLRVGASIGIVPCPDSGSSPDDLYRAADGALYEAKEAGRCTWRWGKADSYTFTA